MTNYVRMTGLLIKDLVKTDEIKGETFYATEIRVTSESGVHTLVVRVSDRFAVFNKLCNGVRVRLCGSVRTRNVKIGNERRKHLDLTVLCSDIEVLESSEQLDENFVIIEGTLAKSPYLHTVGKNIKICEQLMCTERGHNKVSFIPVVYWGRNAEYVNSLGKGKRIRSEGYLRSRTYTKRLDDGTVFQGVAYEFSASTVQVLHPVEI